MASFPTEKHCWVLQTNATTIKNIPRTELRWQDWWYIVTWYNWCIFVHSGTQWYTWYIVTDNGTQCYTSVHHVTHPKGFQGGTLYGLKGLYGRLRLFLEIDWYRKTDITTNSCLSIHTYILFIQWPKGPRNKYSKKNFPATSTTNFHIARSLCALIWSMVLLIVPVSKRYKR